MAPIRDPVPGGRPIDRARAALDQGARAVKTWWRSIDAPERPGAALDLTTEAPSTPHPNGSSSGVGDGFHASVVDELDRLRRDLGARDAELLHALQRLAESYERIAERLENDSRERQMLTEAVLRLERRLPAVEVRSGPTRELPTGERVIGGRVSAPEAQPDLPPPEVSPASVEAFESR